MTVANPSSSITTTTTTNIGDRATILVEFKADDGHHQVIEVRLCTGAATYRCNVSLSDVSGVFKGDASDDDDTDTTQILKLGRLLLREHAPGNAPGNNGKQVTVNSSDRSQNLTISFQYESESEISDNNGCNAKDDKSQDLFLVIQEKVVNEMKRTINRTKMEKLEGIGISYGVAIGDTLNRSLKEVETLKSGVSRWKKTAENLDRVQQENKDTLLANFTKLRNWLNEKHQTELEKLKQAHEKEKETWTAESVVTTRTAAKSKKRRRNDELDLVDPINDDNKELFEGEDALALAEGRKRSAKNKNRKAVLKANEAVDMVGVLKEGQAFDDDRKEKRMQKRKRKQQQQQQEKNQKSDSEDDNDKNNGSRDRNDKRKGIHSPPVKDNVGDDSTASVDPKRTFHAQEESKKQKVELPKVIRAPTRTTKMIVPEKNDDASTSSELSWTLK